MWERCEWSSMHVCGILIWWALVFLIEPCTSWHQLSLFKCVYQQLCVYVLDAYVPWVYWKNKPGFTCTYNTKFKADCQVQCLKQQEMHAEICSSKMTNYKSTMINRMASLAILRGLISRTRIIVHSSLDCKNVEKESGAVPASAHQFWLQETIIRSKLTWLYKIPISEDFYSFEI